MRNGFVRRSQRIAKGHAAPGLGAWRDPARRLAHLQPQERARLRRPRHNVSAAETEHRVHGPPACLPF